MLTIDHKPDSDIERARIEGCGGYIAPMKDNNGIEMGPSRIWKDERLLEPGLAVSRGFGDCSATHLGVTCEPGRFNY